ncbi:MAG: M48 family metalloprotease [Gammaproteobacteria bacterium]|nr:M48 family metalloprotease [Gammaproteobacteria bacterium]MCI0591406.1 M48 family metalloprotease [Gammaproteobacteria bacterium]
MHLFFEKGRTRDHVYVGIVASLCGFMIASCASGGGPTLDLNKVAGIVSKSQYAFTTIDEQEELAIGSGLASTLLGAAPLVDNQPVQDYVNDVGMWLALQTERPELPWRFGVLETDDVNAFAVPGGYVFITKGLFLRLRDEGELAGVLSHEISHVIKRHHIAAIKKNAQAGIVSDAVGIAADQTGYNLDPFIGVGMELYARGLDKEDEFQADRMGVVIATRGGYVPYGLVGVLVTLNGINPQDNEFALMFKTHPPPRERIERLEGLMGPEFDRFATQAQLPQRLRSTQAVLRSESVQLANKDTHVEGVRRLHSADPASREVQSAPTQPVQGKLAFVTLGSADTVIIQMSGIGNNYRRYGVDETRLKNEITERLQDAGLTVQSNEKASGLPMAVLMDIKLHANYNTTTGVYSYLVTVNVTQNARGSTAIWTDALNNYARETDLKQLNGDILTIIDRFVRDYRAERGG